MAETAKILNPDKIVVVPDMAAGCSLADGCPADRFRAWRAHHPGAVAITYINCSAEVKAESDYICTSSNAEKIVRAIPEDKEILFAPDKNLGRYLEKKLGRKMTLWQGSCIVHETFSERKIVALLERHPDAELIAHPECEEPILRHAQLHRLDDRAAQVRDQRTARRSSSSRPRSGILHQMRKAAPAQRVHPAARPRPTAPATSARSCSTTRSRRCTSRCAIWSRASRCRSSYASARALPIDRMLALSN